MTTSLSWIYGGFNWFSEWCGLRSLYYLFGVSLNRRRLNRIVARITTLKSIADVDACVFAAFGNRNSSRPPKGSNNVDSVADSLTFATLSVKLSVSCNLAKERGLLTREFIVCINISEAFNFRFGGLCCLKSCTLFLFGKSWGNVVLTAAVLHDNRVNIGP